MKNLFKIGMSSLLALTIFVGCQEDDAIADTSANYLSVRVVGDDDVVAFPGETISISLELRSSQGLSTLTANGTNISLEIDEDTDFTGTKEGDLSYRFTVPTTSDADDAVDVEFVVTDSDGNTDNTTFSIVAVENPSTFTAIDNIDLGSGEGAAEISAYDTATMQLFVVNNDDADGNNRIDILNFSDPSNISYVSSIELSSFGAGANSIAISAGRLAVAVEANNAQDNGVVLVYNTNNLGTAPTQITIRRKSNHVR
ncbi:MAG: hypothetical protein AAFY41_08160 [Bacteroidota bacterium]